MIEFPGLLEFSHTHCVAICAVLLPVNLLATLQTIILTVLERSSWVWKTAGLASLCAGIMVLHVLTWFVIGVVAIQTFVLLTLGSVCLGINLWAVLHPQSLRWVVVGLRQAVLRPV
ncbi:hypothetical protein [Leptothermofonsia sp. ETS-13]|uniref:hypothetical protein n=1 Tax=Leptothermofonsia sp. ETS-13 TaxID=3035696 RepID=UPI003B9F3EC2